jgi:tetratricopeptide (TPR) repeat protein
LVLESASVSYGKTTSYLPIVDLLKRYFKIQQRDHLREIREKVAGKLVTLEESLRSLLPALLALLNAPVDDVAWQALDPPQRRHRTLDALKRVLLRESQVQPLLLIFEDLHWIDSETQAFLDSLVESLPAASILLLVNYRPEYRHGWGGKSFYTQLRLDPLSPASADDLLRALIGTDPSLAALTSLLISRTEGNPFFLEESVQTLVETQVLAGERGAYRLAQPLTSLQMPATVQAVLAARIDRLPPKEKQLLQTAAVIGKDVPLPLLQAVAELPEEEMQRGLSHLQAAEFLYEARLFPEREYTFKHAMTHEGTYGSLLQERRRALHAQIVAAIETLAVERVAERVERLAHHAVRGEVWDKALAYCRQTSAMAAEHAAYRQAVMSSQQALVALGHLPESHERQAQTIDVHLALQASLWQIGEVPQMLDHLVQAQTLAMSLGDQTRLGAVFARMSFYLFLISQHDRAVEAGERALAIAKSRADTHLEVETNLNLARIYVTLGDYRVAMNCLRHNLGALDGGQLGQLRESDRERYLMLFLQSRSWLGRCLAELGSFPDGVALVESVMQIVDESERPFTQVAACRDFGHVALTRGDFDRATPALERGVAVCRAAPVPGLFPISASLLGAAYVATGRVAEALPLLEQAVERAAWSRLTYGQSLWTSLLAEGYLRAGRLDEANARALEAAEFARTHNERAHQASALRLLGEIHAHHSAVELAEAYYHQALTLAEELGMRPLVAHCHLGLGKLYRRMGRRQEAQEHLTTATSMYREMGMTYWLERAEAEMT